MGLRQDLRDHLKTELGDGIQVYPAGAEVVAAPCVVLNPADPYQVPISFQGGSGSYSSTIAWGLEVWLVVARGGPADVRITELEEMRVKVTNALTTFTPRGVWGALGGFSTIDIAGVDHATASLEVVFRITETIT